MASYAAGAFSTELQAAEISNDDGVVLLVEAGGTVAGYASLIQESTPPEVPVEAAIEIQRFYVGHEYHGAGVAQLLMDAALAAAHERGASAVWLAVWESNPRAIAFYRKCGFSDVGSKVFSLGTDLQSDRIMWRPVNCLSR